MFRTELLVGPPGRPTFQRRGEQSREEDDDGDAGEKGNGRGRPLARPARSSDEEEEPPPSEPSWEEESSFCRRRAGMAGGKWTRKRGTKEQGGGGRTRIEVDCIDLPAKPGFMGL